VFPAGGRASPAARAPDLAIPAATGSNRAMDPGSQVALASPLELCPSCGRISREGSHCPHCGKPIVLDVRLAPAPSDAGQQFRAARVSAEAGVPGVTFGSVKAALATGKPLASGVARDAARVLAEALQAEGFQVSVRPAAPARAPSGRPRALAWAGLAAAALAVAVAGGLLLAPARRAPAPAGSPPAAAPVAPEKPSSPSPEGETAPAARSAPDRGAGELFRAAAPALATVTCPGRLGSGFFVGPDRLLTNAHVTCGLAGELAVKLPRGRELIGKVKAIDEWLDYAVVDVFGAQIEEPIPLGDSTALEPGAPVVILGSPLGLDATLLEGKVSAAARNLEGVAHLQLNADVNPGNSGGPVLDGAGRAVGMVTLRQAGGGGVGFALPLEYVQEATGGPLQGAQRERWEETLSRVKAEDEEQATGLADQLARAVLIRVSRLEARPGEEALGLSVIKRDPSGSYSMELEIREGGTVLCQPAATVSRWVDLEEKLAELAADPTAERRVRWMARRGLSAGVKGGLARVPLRDCPRSVPPKSVIMLKGDSAQSLPFPLHELADARREGAALADRIAEEQRVQDEVEWRAAFGKARAGVARLEADAARMRRSLDEQRDARAVEEARASLPRVEGELLAARAALEELERQASARGIPLEWRR
jgi:S1-C subfamily serine protease